MHFSLTSEQVSPLTLLPRCLTPHRFHPSSDTLCPSAMSIFTRTFVTFREPAQDISRPPPTPLQSNLHQPPSLFPSPSNLSHPLTSTPRITNVTAVWDPFQSYPHFLEELFRAELIYFHFFPTSLLLDSYGFSIPRV
jgi:hypothetical protein